MQTTNKISKTNFPYKMKGETLQKVDHQPYLGVELSNNLKYNLHIDQTPRRHQNAVFTLVCIYAPNCRSSSNSFFKKVSDKIQEHGIGIPIGGGDFNETIKSIDRKTSRSNKNNQPVSSFKNFIKSNKLVNIWRYLNEKYTTIFMEKKR